MYIRFLVFPLVEASNCCVFLWIGDSPLLKFVAAAAVEAQPVGRRRVGLSEAAVFLFFRLYARRPACVEVVVAACLRDPD